MKKFERLVYDAVKKNPVLKKRIRNIYQDMFSLFPVKRKNTKFDIVTREGFFFGFHDHTPFSAQDDMMLANRYLIPLRYPTGDDALEVGFFTGQQFNKWHSVGKTFAWNWHMGCKLQWKGGQNVLMYNDYKTRQFFSKMYNVDSGSTHEIDWPIGTISPDGNWAAGYSFERAQKYMPGYGYSQTGTEIELEKKTSDNSYLYLINLKTGGRKNLISVSDLASYKPEQGSENAFHFISHTVFCPSNKRILFLHRWVTDNVSKRKTRMFTCDLDGNNLCLFPTKEMVSHIGWRNENEIVAYARLLNGEDRYVIFKDMTDQYNVIAKHSFNSDGHPSFSPDGRWMLTDTYPDRTRRSYLALYDLITDRRFNIAYLHSPQKYRTTKKKGHISCDLHPRWDRTGRIVSFDATFTGQRALCTIDLNDLNKIESKAL